MAEDLQQQLRNVYERKRVEGAWGGFGGEWRRQGQPTGYFPRWFFPVWGHHDGVAELPMGKTAKRRTGGHRKSYQLELMTAVTVLPRLSCKRRSRSMAARTGWVPRWR